MSVGKVLIFGGAFSPPTLAHEAIIAECLKLPGFDEVWLLPSNDRDDKTMSASAEHRLAMLNIMITSRFADEPRLGISEFELALPHETKTSKTVQALAKTHPDAQFWFVFGNDSYRDMPNWQGGLQLKSTLNLVVFGDKKPAGLAAGAIFMGTPAEYSDVSSTLARQSLAHRNKAVGLVNDKVAQYAVAHNLY